MNPILHNLRSRAILADLKTVLVKHNAAASHQLWLDINALYNHHCQAEQGSKIAPAPLSAATPAPTPAPVETPAPATPPTP